MPCLRCYRNAYYYSVQSCKCFTFISLTIKKIGKWTIQCPCFPNCRFKTLGDKTRPPQGAEENHTLAKKTIFLPLLQNPEKDTQQQKTNIRGEKNNLFFFWKRSKEAALGILRQMYFLPRCLGWFCFKN